MDAPHDDLNPFLRPCLTIRRYGRLELGRILCRICVVYIYRRLLEYVHLTLLLSSFTLYGSLFPLHFSLIYRIISYYPKSLSLFLY